MLKFQQQPHISHTIHSHHFFFGKAKISHFHYFAASNKGGSALFQNRSQSFVTNGALVVPKLIRTAASSTKAPILDTDKADKLPWTANTWEPGNSPDCVLDPAKPGCCCPPSPWQRGSSTEGSSYCWEEPRSRSHRLILLFCRHQQRYPTLTCPFHLSPLLVPSTNRRALAHLRPFVPGIASKSP